jgi:hypothetical protein
MALGPDYEPGDVWRPGGGELAGVTVKQHETASAGEGAALLNGGELVGDPEQ